MTAKQKFCAVAVLGWGVFLASASDELSRIWAGPSETVRERARAVNRAFTNGTPVSVVVGALGTKHTLCGMSARLWLGPGPEPSNTLWLSYRFGEGQVTIHTTAVLGRELDVLASKFTSAGYSLPPGPSIEPTDRVQTGEPSDPTNGRQPSRSEPNQTEAAAGAVPTNAAALVQALERESSYNVERDAQGRVVMLRLPSDRCCNESVALLRQLPELRNLWLYRSRENVSADGIRLLRQNTNLCSLTFACFFTNLPTGILSEVAALPYVTRVQFVSAEPPAPEYTALAHMTNLTDLQIDYGIYFADGELALFTNAPSLRNLIVRSRALTSNSAALLPRFHSLTNAELMNLTDRTSWKCNWPPAIGSVEGRK
jgi:hypothetical protein